MQGAIVIMGVLHLADLGRGRRLARASLGEAVVWFVALVGVLLVGVSWGLGLAASLSLLLLLRQALYPRVVVVDDGQKEALPTAAAAAIGEEQPGRKAPWAVQAPACLSLSVAGPITFVGAQFLRAQVLGRARGAPRPRDAAVLGIPARTAGLQLVTLDISSSPGGHAGRKGGVVRVEGRGSP